MSAGGGGLNFPLPVHFSYSRFQSPFCLLVFFMAEYNAVLWNVFLCLPIGCHFGKLSCFLCSIFSCLSWTAHPLHAVITWLPKLTIRDLLSIHVSGIVLQIFDLRNLIVVWITLTSPVTVLYSLILVHSSGQVWNNFIHLPRWPEEIIPVHVLVKQQRIVKSTWFYSQQIWIYTSWNKTVSHTCINPSYCKSNICTCSLIMSVGCLCTIWII